MVIAARQVRDRAAVPIKVCLAWVIINGLGIATHYFFIFTLGAEAIVLLCLGLVQSWQERGIWHPSAHWQRIWIVAAGTAAASLIWWPVLQDIQGGELTRWIYSGDRSGLAWLDPIGQAIAGWITMIYLLPIQAEAEEIKLLAGGAMVLLTLWTLPKLYRGLRVQLFQRESRLGVRVISLFVVSAIALFFSVTYFFEADLTGAFRYNFVFFPGAIVLAGAGLASSWDVALHVARSPATQVPPVLLGLLRVSSRKTVVLIWLLGLVGAVTVLTNLGYQKTHRPDLVATVIQQESQNPVLIAIPHQTHGQTGRLMGLALALQQPSDSIQPQVRPQFLLAHMSQTQRSVIVALRRALNSLPRPLDLWLINMQTVPEDLLDDLLDQQSCDAEDKAESVDGYRYRLYRCLEPAAKLRRNPPLIKPID
jgi:uncharacterized membrane protein